MNEPKKYWVENEATKQVRKWTHISEGVYRKILKEFCCDPSATETADRIGISRIIINAIYQKLRTRIGEITDVESREIFTDESGIDESYFGARRVQGKRGRGAGEKIPIFGILKRRSSVYTKIVENCSRAQLQLILKGKYLRVLAYTRTAGHHTMGSYWSWAKHRSQKFNGTDKNHFALHLKECQWRFNHRAKSLYGILLSELRGNPLKIGRQSYLGPISC